MWSPWLHERQQREHLRRLPEAVASAARPPSSAAMRSSNTATVGLRDARVDVAERLQVEQARRVVGAESNT